MHYPDNINNIKLLATKHYASFALMGLSSFILWSHTPPEHDKSSEFSASFLSMPKKNAEKRNVGTYIDNHSASHNGGIYHARSVHTGHTSQHIADNALKNHIKNNTRNKNTRDDSVDYALRSSLVTMHNKERLQKIGNFDLPDNIKPNNISKHIAKVQLEKKEYFLALASQAEGYRANIYKDNEGWAVGNGWNLTKQSPQYNKDLAQAVFKDKKTVDTLTHMSAQSEKKISAAQMQSVQMAPGQALQVTYLIGEKIRADYVIPGISQVIQNNRKIEKPDADKMAEKVFNNLKKNEQETLIYHAYKCGGYSFVKFNNLISKIVDYSLKTKPVSRKSIIAEFNYSYRLDGKKYLDKQSQELVGSMFLGPQQFAEVTNIELVNFDAKDKKLADSKLKTIASVAPTAIAPHDLSFTKTRLNQANVAINNSAKEKLATQDKISVKTSLKTLVSSKDSKNTAKSSQFDTKTAKTTDIKNTKFDADIKNTSTKNIKNNIPHVKGTIEKIRELRPLKNSSPSNDKIPKKIA